MTFTTTPYVPQPAPNPLDARSAQVWPITVVVLVVSTALTYLAIDQGWGGVGKLVAVGIAVATLGVLTLAARAMSAKTAPGEGLVSALVGVVVLLPMAGFLYVTGSAISAVTEIGDGIGGMFEGFDVSPGEAVGDDPFSQCMTDPNTTLEQCMQLQD